MPRIYKTDVKIVCDSCRRNSILLCELEKQGREQDEEIEERLKEAGWAAGRSFVLGRREDWCPRCAVINRRK